MPSSMLRRRTTDLVRLTVLGRIAGAGLLTALATGGAYAARDALGPMITREAPSAGGNLADTTRTLVYRIPDRGRVRFILSQPTTIVRITSQPNIDPGDWRRDRTWTYGYRAVLRDGDGAIVAAHDIYSRALHPDRLRAYKRPVRFHRTSRLQIALQDEAVIEASTEVAMVDLVALDRAAGVRSVDARLYERLPFIGTSAMSAFRRRAPDEQADLARADAFSAELLSDRERSSLMTNRWKAVGPAGIAGRDYQVEVVYERPFAPRRDDDGGGV